MRPKVIVGIAVLLMLAGCGSGPDEYTTGAAMTRSPSAFSKTYKFPTPSPSAPSPAEPSTPTPSPTASPATRPEPAEATLEDALAPLGLDRSESSFASFCSYPFVVVNNYEKYGWGGWQLQTEGLEVALTLMGFDVGPVDGFGGRKTAAAVEEAFATFRVEPESKFKTPAWRKLKNIACWGPREEYPASYGFWVANWPNGLDVMETGDGDQTSPQEDPLTEYMQELWDASSSQFRQAQCSMWRADPAAFAYDSIIAFESGADASTIYSFMALNC